MVLEYFLQNPVMGAVIENAHRQAIISVDAVVVGLYVDDVDIDGMKPAFIAALDV